MIKAVAIDDEPLALEILESFCERIDGLKLEKKFTSQNEAQRYINKFEVDLLFLDIQMPRQNGIELYKSLKQETKVIFTTAHSEFAVEGFEVRASDYILKPISFERFKEAVERVKQELQLELNNVRFNTHLSLRADYKLYTIPLEQILFIEAMDDYVKVKRLGKPTVVARSTMKGILEKLPEANFTRIHKSYIVNNSKVEAVKASCIEIAGAELPIRNTYKEQVLSQFSV
ncbi:LytR/AlgR family response regulator transcription factor [Leeuwenhoekiella parthenopeia]|uniref:LytTR family DNA-binding domain-containing protein n=1 Tax=Leeuwenhoekiella parthenopeia TaxID=2890320 RepID=A0ABS8GSW7_9FLAO|nr:LytTR family DNA-binding domain-containing protein [Leeuwenhoekiella parthenopeia]MCC4213092.1 LytTR family DNA-binding domain-containing protein [Leeuwenhoekiella parthenopeia]